MTEQRTIEQEVPLITRYSMRWSGKEADLAMHEDTTGQWVDYRDAQQAVQAAFRYGERRKFEGCTHEYGHRWVREISQHYATRGDPAPEYCDHCGVLWSNVK